MSVLKDKKKFAFVDDESIDTNEMPKNLQELNKSGRGIKKDENQKKSGRPLKNDEDKRESLMLYLTKEQKDELRLRAKNANLPMNAYIVVKLFGVK